MDDFSSPVVVAKPIVDQRDVDVITTSVDMTNNVGTNGRRTFRMVALDLDGTLLQSSHQMADIQAEYLRNLHERGFVVCFATGRAAPSVYEHVQKLNLPDPIPVVCSNGSRGFNIDAMTLQKQQLFDHPVPKDAVYDTLRIAQQQGYAVQYYLDDSIYVNSTQPEHVQITQKYSQLTGSTILPVLDNFESMLQQNKLPSKLLVLFDESQIMMAAQRYRSEFSSKGQQQEKKATVVLGTYDWFLEILHPIVNKGNGLQRLCQLLNIPLQDCIAIGDGANDLEFLQMAGLGLAMQNAKEMVKNSADTILPWTNDDHGVMKALQQLDSEGKLQI